MRLGQAATACLLLGLALVLAACGEERTAAMDRAAVGASASSTAVKPPSAPAARGCRDQLQPFVGAMAALRERLAVGLSYEDYLREVRRLRAVHAELPVERLAIGCLTVAGAPGERALNRYLEAANAWGECLATVSCDAEEVEPRLQRRWALASELLSVAQEGLR